MSFLMLLARLINAVRIKVLVIMIVIPMISMAQDKAAKTAEKKTTTVDFEDELVEGELKKPELFYLLQKKQFNFKRLIKLRENFLPEMRRTSEDIQRSGSGN